MSFAFFLLHWVVLFSFSFDLLSPISSEWRLYGRLPSIILALKELLVHRDCLANIKHPR